MKFSINLLLLIILGISSLTFYAQVPKQEKRIYLLDVTASMEGKDDAGAVNIFQDVKDKLAAAITNLKSEQTEIVVIPFTSITFPKISGDFTSKEKLSEKITSLKIQRGETNIENAWKRGVEELDSTKINFLFLLTDGIHNYGSSKEVLYNTLSEWEEVSQDKYYFAFYVMLTPNAKEMEITQIADKTPQIWVVESLDVNISLVSLPLSATVNTEGKNKIFRFSFTPINGINFKDDEFIVKINENPYYELKGYNPRLEEGYITFQLKEKKPHTEIPLSYPLKLNFLHNQEVNPLLFFTPETINLKVKNIGSRTMTIKQKGGAYENQ